MPIIKYINGEKKFIYSIQELRDFITRIIETDADLSEWESKFIEDMHIKLCFGLPNEKEAEKIEQIYAERTK